MNKLGSPNSLTVNILIQDSSEEQVHGNTPFRISTDTEYPFREASADVFAALWLILQNLSGLICPEMFFIKEWKK